MCFKLYYVYNIVWIYESFWLFFELEIFAKNTMWDSNTGNMKDIFVHKNTDGVCKVL